MTSNLHVAIISCNKNLEKLASLRETWVQDLNNKSISYQFYVGDNTSTADTDVIALKCSDDYSHLRYKTFAMLEHTLKNYDFDFLVKTDDDTFIDIDNLLNLNIKDCDYVGNFSTFYRFLKNKEEHIGYIKKRSLNQDVCFDYAKHITEDFGYAEGGFYILSRSAAQSILNYAKNNKNVFDIIQEDIFIGYMCNKLNLKCKNISIHIPWYDVSSNNISFHPIKSFLMRKLYKSKTFDSRVDLLKKYLLKNKYFIKTNQYV